MFVLEPDAKKRAENIKKNHDKMVLQQLIDEYEEERLHISDIDDLSQLDPQYEYTVNDDGYVVIKG